MRITAIIPVYNCEKFIVDALESVLEQSHPIDEIIVVNDGSTDRTGEILTRFGKRIRTLEQPNKGGAAAVNAGVSVATGDVLTLLDADDFWAVNKTEVQANALLRDQSIEAVFGMVRQFQHEDGLKRAQVSAIANPPQPGIHKGAMMIRREALDRVGLFDEALRFVDFVNWYMRATDLKLRWRLLEDVASFRRVHDHNMGRLHRAEQAKGNLLSLKQMLDRRRANGC